MVEIMKTTSGHHIRSVRAVNPSWQRTADGNHVTPIRLIEPPLWPAGLLRTPSGFPMQAVRFVDAAGLYTTNRAAVSATPEDVFTPDGNPIEAVAVFSSVPAPEVVFTLDGRFIEAVWAVDAAGVAVTADADVTAWAAQVVTNGGTVSAARQVVLNEFVIAEKAAGTWALTDDYWGLWGENAIQSLTSLKQRRLATVVAAPTFTADRGYAFNGTTQYVNTGFVPSTHEVAATGTNMRAAVYERVACSTNSYSIAAANSASQCFGMRARVSTTMACNFNGSNVGSSATTNNLGLCAASRPGTAVYEFYQRGALVAPGSAPTGMGSTPTTHALYIGAQNNGGTAGSFRVVSTGFACAGASFTLAQEAAQYANVQAWATSIGAQV